MSQKDNGKNKKNVLACKNYFDILQVYDLQRKQRTKVCFKMVIK